MRLEAQCPRCPALVTSVDDGWECPTHQGITPLWRVIEPDYETFAEHLQLSHGLPSWVPWPLPIDWRVTDFGCVGGEGLDPQASFVSCAGIDAVDGLVQVTVVSEEPGVGLGARCGRVPHSDPGREMAEEPPHTKVRVDGGTAALWIVSTSDDSDDNDDSDSGDGGDGGADDALDRTVLAGEAMGRWLWLVLRPASALLSVPQMPPLVDVSGLGPQLLALPFGNVARPW